MSAPWMEPAIPQLPSGDLDVTRRFYVEQMGFKVAAMYPDQGFLILRRDAAEIHFWRASSEQEAKQYGSASSCYIRVENIQSLHDELLLGGVELRYGLVRQPWGMYEMQVDDPYGNAIRLGEEYK